MSRDVNSLYHVTSITPNKMADNDMSFRQRAVIEFLVKEEIPAAEIHQRRQRAYGSVCMGASSIRRWVKHFKDANTSIQDQPRSGRPRTASNERNKERLDEIIQDERRVTVDTDYHLFGFVKDQLRGQRYETTEAIQKAVRQCLRMAGTEFYKRGIFKLPVTLGEMCTKKWRLCGKIKKGLD